MIVLSKQRGAAMDYKNEVKNRFGNTAEYKEYEKKSLSRTNEKEAELSKGLMNIIREIGTLRDKDPFSSEVISKIGELKAYITENYYSCSDEMLVNLGNMYVEDKRFKENIDNAAGAGTALFIKKAIDYYITSKP